MNVMESHVDAGQDLPPKERQAYYTALVEYLAYGREPSLSGAAKAVFTAIRPTLDNSRARAEAGRAGGRQGRGKQEAKRKQSQSNREAKPDFAYDESGKQTRGKQEAKANANGKQSHPVKEVCSQQVRGSYQESPSLSFSPYGEGVQGEGFEPPTVEEARTYFAASALKGDPAEFVDHFDAQGWIRGNGRPVEDWRALARMWSRNQVEFDAEKPQVQAPPPKPTDDWDDPAELARLEAEFAAEYGGGA